MAICGVKMMGSKVKRRSRFPMFIDSRHEIKLKDASMSEDEQSSITELRRELDEKIANVREEMKEKEPNVLAAIRTFVDDLVAWNRGDRSVPRSAAIGLAFALLRPRIILVIGSIAAIGTAILQIFLIWGQNEILAEQSKFLKAQTIGTIVKELRENDPTTNSNGALVSIFGEVAFDVVSKLVVSGDAVRIDVHNPSRGDLNAWMNAALIVAGNSNKLTVEASRSYRRKLIHQYNNLRLASHDAYVAMLQQSSTSTGVVENQFNQPLGDLRLDYVKYMRAIAKILRDLHASHPPALSRYDALNSLERHEVIEPVITYYVQRRLYGSEDDAVRVPLLDEELSAICRSTGGRDLSSGLEVSLVTRRAFRTSPPPLDEVTRIKVTLIRWCGLKIPGEYPNSDVYPLPVDVPDPD